MTPTAAMTVLAALLGAVALAGCAHDGRTTRFPLASAPTATADQIVVQITEIERSAGSVILRLSIANPTADPVVFTRHYKTFTAMTVVHGSERVAGLRIPIQSRTISPDQYVVVAGEHADLRLDFRAAGIDRATDLTLTIQGSTRGIAQTWSIVVPPEPSQPTAITP